MKREKHPRFITIKSCPFCGGKAALMTEGGKRVHMIAYVTCTKCAATGPVIRNITIPTSARKSEEAVLTAVEEWNKRYTPSEGDK